MTSQEQTTITYAVTVASMGPVVAKLEARGDLVRVSEPRLAEGRRVVDVTVRGRPRSQRRLRRWSVAVAVAFPAAGVAGHVTGVAGAEVIGQVLAAAGSVASVGFLVYAAATQVHRRHCPGCPDH